MSTRTRKRRPASTSTQAAPAAQPAPAPQPVPMPVWHWRTFPVYMAFSVGGFLGLYMGILAGATGGDSSFTMVVFVFWALLLGFGLSRLVSAWMISHGWSRPRPKRKKK